MSGKPVNPATGSVDVPGRRLPWFPLANPGIVSIPASFLLGFLGTVMSQGGQANPAKSAEMEVRSLTGAGAEKAIDH